MRLGVLDIGSNTGHLLVVDAHDGAAPLPAYSYKQPLRLAEHLDADGAVSRTGVEALTSFVAEALVVAEDKGCEEMLGFATSAVRDAANAVEVLDHVRDRTGAAIEVLTGEDEARLTFLAVRRWFGWSSGRLAVFDIGGGSLEIAAGADESPDVAWSLPLGAARLAARGSATARRTRARCGPSARGSAPTSPGTPGTSCAPAPPTMRWRPPRPSGRWPGSAAPHPPGRALCVSRVLPADQLAEWIPKLMAMTDEELSGAAGRLVGPHPPDRSRRTGGRGGARHLRPARARDLSVGVARGRHPRAHRPDQPSRDMALTGGTDMAH